MLALVSIFLATLLVAVATIWLYRSLAGWQGLKGGVDEKSPKGSKAGLKLSAQQGFISPFASSKGMIKYKRLRSPEDGIKAPWGW